MSQAFRSVIPLVNLMNELIPTLYISYIKPILKCKVFEDNQSTIVIARATSVLTRTKYIGLKHHHFRKFVLSRLVDIKYVSTENQLGDIFTKPLPPSTFTYLRHGMIG